MIRLWSIWLLIHLSWVLTAQENASKFRMSASRTDVPMVLDGKIDESFWNQAQPAQNFYQAFPEDSVQAIDQTIVKIAFDDHYLYIGGICYESSDKEDIVASLRRDFRWSVNENISIYLDPFNDYTNGFTFGLTPLGVQREGLVTAGSDVNTDWDNKWKSEVHRFEDRWEFEMAIPFKTLRYDDTNRDWNVVFLRNNLKSNERTTWAIVPQGFGISAFAFSGRLTFDEALPKAGTNLSIIPFVASGVSKDLEARTAADGSLQVGFDAKVGVTSSLNLDLTVNPDFSQVEVDRQVTNLGRFEIRFPERRQFFLENQDLFGEGGFGDSRPFFSRRIGIAQDTAGNSIQVPITYGARLSGKIGQNWRVGFLNMQSQRNDAARLTGTEEIADTYKLLAQNYTVGILQRQVFGQSNVNFTVVNRQAMNYDDNDSTISTTQFNRVAGIDYNLLSADGRWEGDFYIHQSFDPEKKETPISGGTFLRYNTTRFNLGVFNMIVGEGYNAELGFIQRKDIVRGSIFGNYRIYPDQGGIINNHGPGGRYSYFSDLEFDKTDEEIEINYNFNLNNTAEVNVEYGRTYQRLRSDFEPITSYVFNEGQAYEWQSIRLRFNTDRRKLLWVEGRVQLGGFYNGQLYRYQGSVNYRYQPYLNLALDFDHGRIKLPSRVLADNSVLSGKSNIWLISPRADITFTDKIFLTTFLQYNQRDNNVNLNTRFQWRFKPVSDIFLVYTDNYFPDSFASKNRAIVFKLTYWLNV